MQTHAMKHLLHSDDIAIGFQIAPMIDVVFVIMLFFMVMTGSVKVERERAPGCPIREILSRPCGFPQRRSPSAFSKTAP